MSLRDELVRDNLAAWFLEVLGDYMPRARANTLLASGVLDQIRADAWDEGYRKGQQYHPDPKLGDPLNPYRSEARDG